MNEQLQIALAEILRRATQGLDAGTQFLSAQLPDVVNQLLMWKLAHYTIPMVLAAMLLLVLLVAGWKFYSVVMADPRIVAEAAASARYRIYNNADRAEDFSKLRQDWRDAQEVAEMLPEKVPIYIALGILMGIAALFSTMLLIASLNLKWLQILIAPKIYLIEYAASLAK